ncbi:phosphatidylserine decarboxylase [Fictibacillus barbaricus]|uniref:phosphatidylserine decarboxylase n=1 Tax=Fictibacillus barbaricus TaxID=182136 RepID=A0ABS2Z839_9BACL|nr:phosphatidylserine decarboxylase [Fictibacillus barbaricus]MBN3544270.1 phosphatidylserine decarboxylase [Fictibacillus barbaricus]GGB68144.1 phosphatidylserine decarboxylase proenzyme [Fictibacillus barbaricus]
MKMTRFYRNIFELNGHPIVARSLKRFAQSKVSKPLVPSFVKLYKIDINEATRQLTDYSSLHDVFVRDLKPGARPITTAPNAFVSPCDGVLSVVEELTQESRFTVKGQEYTVAELLGSDSEAEQFSGGQVLIFYLSPTDYHRVHVPVDASVESVYTLGREAAPVNELGLRHGLRPLTRNYRLVSKLKAEGHPLAHVMVGALNVNTIERTNTNPVVHRGDPYGYFSFGSTVVLCVPKGALEFTGKTGPVKMGEQLGRWVPKEL